ncbi:GNAT family N-acetyltransferase [Desulfocurvibacter africanus]|uniref:GNAT family N-acetyltransferase n=1 Tax=Desulfocurvibacter africanus TaxID=873 RepID=UPI000687B10B|nr:GNAT family N-acetyltransferase [Desulfocurvibacter africanus]
MGQFEPVQIVAKSGVNFIIRHGVEGDASALITLATQCIEDGEGQIWVPGEFNLTEEQEREWIKGLRENPNELLLVAEAEGNIVGVMDFHVGKRKRTCHAGMLGTAVAKDWRSQGVGSALLGEIIKWAKSNPEIEKLSLRVLANNHPSIGLCKKFGFQQEGYGHKEVKLGPNEYLDDVLMCLFVG